MKKTLLRVVCAIVVVMMALSVVASAETRVPVTNKVSGGAGIVDGEFTVYAKDQTFVGAETDVSTNGITVSSSEAAVHCIWAGTKDVATQYRYLHYVIREDMPTLLYFYVGYYTGAGYDQSLLVAVPVTAGEHTVDLQTEIAGYDLEERAYFCLDIAINANSTVAIDEFYLTDGASEEEPPATADMIGIFATIAAAAAAVVVFTKKH